MTAQSLGFDPNIYNLFWVAGLGGRGVSMSFVLMDLIYTIFTENKKRNNNENDVKNPFTASRFV